MRTSECDVCQRKVHHPDCPHSENARLERREQAELARAEGRGGELPKPQVDYRFASDLKPPRESVFDYWRRHLDVLRQAQAAYRKAIEENEAMCRRIEDLLIVWRDGTGG